MAFFFGDGFDLYAQCADAVPGYWDSTSQNLSGYSSLVSGRFSGSRAWSWNSPTTLIKTSGVNDTVHHFVVAVYASFALAAVGSGSAAFYCELWDGATAQCYVMFRTDGALLLYSGQYSGGTLLATYQNAITAANTWFAFEIEVVVNNTTGSITVRKNGNPNNDFTLGSLNTRSSTNNYANKLQLGSAVSNNFYTDDFLWRSDAASVAWIGDVRCFTRHPSLDVSTQFSRTPTAAYNVLLWNPIGVGQSFAANLAFYMQFTTNNTSLLTGVIFTGNGGTGHIKAALYSDVGGAVGTLLATSDELTNPGSPITINFSTPYRIVTGQTYWIAMNNDSGTINFNVISSPVTVITMSSSYASWPPSSPPSGGSVGGNVPGVSIALTLQSNAGAVAEAQQDAATTYVYSSTNGQADFYSIGTIPIAPATIVGVVTRGLFQKSDAGTRNATVQLKSGSTTVQGPNTALNTVWGWIYRNDLVDPSTGVAWTASGVNNVTIGPSVTA